MWRSTRSSEVYFSFIAHLNVFFLLSKAWGPTRKQESPAGRAKFLGDHWLLVCSPAFCQIKDITNTKWFSIIISLPPSDHPTQSEHGARWHFSKLGNFHSLDSGWLALIELVSESISMLYHLTLRAPILVWNHFFSGVDSLAAFFGATYILWADTLREGPNTWSKISQTSYKQQ